MGILDSTSCYWQPTTSGNDLGPVNVVTRPLPSSFVMQMVTSSPRRSTCSGKGTMQPAEIKRSAWPFRELRWLGFYMDHDASVGIGAPLAPWCTNPNVKHQPQRQKKTSSHPPRRLMLFIIQRMPCFLFKNIQGADISPGV